MSWNNVTEEDEKGLFHIYTWENEDKASRQLVYTIDKKNKIIKFFPKDKIPIEEVIIEGFSDLSSEFNKNGYFKQGLNYYLNKKFENLNVNSFIISRDKDNSLRKLPKKKSYNIVLNYNSFSKLTTGLTHISSEAKTERSTYVDELFHEVYPKVYKKVPKTSAKGRARRFVRNIDSSIISELSPQDIEKLVEFFSVLITKRYTSSKSRLELLEAAKIKVDQIAINDVISRFKQLLKEDPSEAKWGEFLQKNLFLVESKYVAVIPELNVMLASQRKVDFGLVDAYDYLDIFEIKKPSTKLLSAKTDRGNYYWHSETNKAIVQAEKYLFNASRKASALKEDIKRERKIDVDIIKPKAVVIIGSSDQLKNASMREDFKILRDSLKNVEIVLYDELLTRLSNQLTKIYSEPELTLKKTIGK